MKLSRRFDGLLFLVLLAGSTLGLHIGMANTTAAELRLGAPLEYQVVQRSGRDTGRILIEGTFSASIPGGGQIEARLTGSGLDGTWQPLTSVGPDQLAFHAELSVPAGGWYQLDVRARHRDETIATAQVEHVGIGEVFVVAGQSNSANHGEERQQSKTGLVSSFSGRHWQVANDPQPGASGTGGSFLPPFADAMATRFKVPVGLVAAGVGATSVREWLPRGTRFPNPPTLTGHVTQRANGEWESKGDLFEAFTRRLQALGPQGFRAVLWHQGESDANQSDPSRTLPGTLYQKYLEQLIRDARREAGWEAPWFVAQASYHTPNDPGSPDLRAAQAALWKSGVALEGPDTDALAGEHRDGGGQGVHFSGRGLREHGARWAEKVSPWLESRLAQPPALRTGADTNNAATTTAPTQAKVNGPTPRLILPGTENFTIEGRPAFVFLPPADTRSTPQPWIFYAPTLPAYPDGAERWMHAQFLAAGVAVAGVDVGEAYGSPQSHVVFDALHRELTEKRGFARKPCLFGRSRGGLWVSSWAIAHPDRVAGIIGIYPVFDFRTYPGLKNAAPAYRLTAAELESRADELNPVARLEVLARARVPVTLIHGDVDTVVPLKENSAALVRRYEEAGAGSAVKLIVLKGQGHNFYEGFFHSQELVDFAIAYARAGR